MRLVLCSLTLIPFTSIVIVSSSPPFNFESSAFGLGGGGGGQELLALGESIGNVSTGLSEDMISNCLKEITYHSTAQIQEEAMCTICLVRPVAPSSFILDPHLDIAI